MESSVCGVESVTFCSDKLSGSCDTDLFLFLGFSLSGSGRFAVSDMNSTRMAQRRPMHPNITNGICFMKLPESS